MMERGLAAKSVPIFNEGIWLVLNRWHPLRLAVDHQLGGPNSRQKADRLCSDILHWFTSPSQEPLHIDDLVNMIKNGLVSLRMVFEDGVVEEVAEVLMVLHEECVEGNFRSVEVMREAVHNQAACPHAIIQGLDSDEDEDEDEDDGDIARDEDEDEGEEEDEDVDIDEGKDKGDIARDNSEDMEVEMQVPVEESKPKTTAEAEDVEWTVVTRRRNRGRN